MWLPWRTPPKPLPEPPPKAVRERLEELEDDMRRLERRFVRLQGEFDRVNRLQVADDEYEEADDDA